MSRFKDSARCTAEATFKLPPSGKPGWTLSPLNLPRELLDEGLMILEASLTEAEAEGLD